MKMASSRSCRPSPRRRRTARARSGSKYQGQRGPPRSILELHGRAMILVTGARVRRSPRRARARRGRMRSARWCGPSGAGPRRRRLRARPRRRHRPCIAPAPPEACARSCTSSRSSRARRPAFERVMAVGTPAISSRPPARAMLRRIVPRACSGPAPRDRPVLPCQMGGRTGGRVVFPDDAVLRPSFISGVDGPALPRLLARSTACSGDAGERLESQRIQPIWIGRSRPRRTDRGRGGGTVAPFEPRWLGDGHVERVLAPAQDVARHPAANGARPLLARAWARHRGRADPTDAPDALPATDA